MQSLTKTENSPEKNSKDSSSLPPASVEHGFILVGSRYYPEHEMTAHLFRHEKLGTAFLSIEGEDDNKVFGIVLPTLPEDNTGVIHILEHSVLGGSEKFRVKDPFEVVSTTSLNTYANATTYPDKTGYHIASLNHKDYLNLGLVYLDAVFKPLLRKETFLQEGWRYEFDQNGILTISGVVFNEMKGLLAGPEVISQNALLKALFPQTPYAFESGGIPSEIKCLTFEQFKETYAKLYHPSNALIVAYGNHDRNAVLTQVAEYMEGVEPLPRKTEIPKQPAISEPVVVKVPLAMGRADEEMEEDAAEEAEGEPEKEESSKLGRVAIGWSLGPDRLGTIEFIGHYLLVQCLAGNSGSPLRRAILASGLAEEMADVNCESHAAQPYLSLGAKGVNPENLEKVAHLILETLGKIAKEGLSKETIESALHQIEFNYRDVDGSEDPLGLSLADDAADAWNSGGDVLDSLSWERELETVKKLALQTPRYLEGMLETLLANRHRATVQLFPQEGLLEAGVNAEKEELRKKQSLLSAAEKVQIVKDQQSLKAFQDKPDSEAEMSKIPRLQVSDLPGSPRTLPSRIIDTPRGTGVCTTTPTRGLIYVSAGFDLKKLPQNLLPLARIFASLLTETGTSTLTAEKFLESRDRWSGQLFATCSVSRVFDSNETQAWLSIGGKALATNQSRFFDLMKMAILDANLANRKRVREFCRQTKSRIESAIRSGGLPFAGSRSRSGFNAAFAANERLHGLEQYFFLKDLIKRVDSDWDSVKKDLLSIREIVFRGDMLWNFAASQHLMDGLLDEAGKLESAIPGGDLPVQTWSFPELPEKEFWVTPSEVSYAAHASAFNVERTAGELLVADKLVDSFYLTEKIRKQGGAYGNGTATTLSGKLIVQSSFRDPAVQESLKVFENTPRFARSFQPSAGDIDGAIIGVISESDTCMSPARMGMAAMSNYLSGNTYEHRQQTRTRILGADASSLKGYADAVESGLQQKRICILGPSGTGKELKKSTRILPSDNC